MQAKGSERAVGHGLPPSPPTVSRLLAVLSCLFLVWGAIHELLSLSRILLGADQPHYRAGDWVSLFGSILWFLSVPVPVALVVFLANGRPRRKSGASLLLCTLLPVPMFPSVVMLFSKRLSDGSLDAQRAAGLIFLLAILALIVDGVVQWRGYVDALLAAPFAQLCAHCRYNLIGNVSGVCPECGTPVPGDLLAGLGGSRSGREKGGGSG